MFTDLFDKIVWLLSAQKSPTVKASLSKKNKALKNMLESVSPPIPDEVWEEMPNSLKHEIKRAIVCGAAIWYKPPLSEEERKAQFGDRLPPFPTMLGNTVTIFYGPLMSRTYSVHGGQCMIMS